VRWYLDNKEWVQNVQRGVQNWLAATTARGKGIMKASYSPAVPAHGLSGDQAVSKQLLRSTTNR